MRRTLIVAADLDDCIGKNNDIPWKIPSDMARFKRLTTGHDVIMGNKTYVGIVEGLGKPLPNRRSLVISRGRYLPEDNSFFFTSPQSTLEWLDSNGSLNNDGEVFVIGGSQIYESFLELAAIERILLTRVHARVCGDTYMHQNWLSYFMQIDATAQIQAEGDEFPTSYTTYERFRRA